MRTDRSSVGVRLAWAIVGILAGLSLTGCQTAQSVVAVPFEMAEHVVVETAKLPIETAKIGATGLANAVFGP